MFLGQQNQYNEISVLLKIIYRFKATPVKIPITLFTEPEKYKNVKANTETTKRKNTAGSITS